MSGQTEGPVRVDERREQVVEALMEHFANDRVDLDEFERRVDAANRAATVEALNGLLADLPAAGALVKSSTLIPAAGGPPTMVARDRVRPSGWALAVFGGTKRKGRWIPARKTRAVAIMGGVSLDFRNAMLGPGVTEVEVFAVCGGVEIIVPPETAVEVDGMAIMGAFENESDAPLERDPKHPLLRIKGFVVMGGAEISVRLPGESQRDARRRRRLERKALRRLTSDWGE